MKKYDFFNRWCGLFAATEAYLTEKLGIIVI
jgi:hypothetical protein